MKDDPVFGRLRLLLSLLPGVIAFLLDWFCWPIINPYAWILFYPAVYFSVWIGGARSGLLTTFALTTAIWWFFLPPRFSFAIERPISWLSILLALVVGILMSLLHGRLRAALRKSQASFATVDDLNQRLEERVRERTDELARTTASVQGSEARLAGIIESAMDAIISVDADQRIVLFNTAAEEVFKCAASGVIGQSLDRFIPPRFREAHTKHIEGFGQTSLTCRSMLSLGELSALRSDGTEFPIEASISQTRVRGQHLFTVILRDITERKETEAQLRERDERIRQIAESLPQLIWTCSPDGVCDFVSRQWEQYAGLPAAELVGGRAIGHVHPDDRAALSEAWAAATASGAEFRAEYRLRRHDGVYRWFDTRATPLRDAEGNLVKWFGSNADIEDQKRAHDMQLRSQKMEALGTLSGGIAHDFNNILLAIIGNTRLAIDDLPANHQALESLREIERASTRAADLVRRILSFSRQEESRKTVIHLRPIIDEAVKLLRSTLPAMIELRSRCAPGVPATIADAGQVHQIIMNLATNAAHAIGPRPGVVEIDLEKIQIDAALARTTPGLHEGTYVRLSVCDNGCGMDKATQQRMFDPFFTTKPVGQGTGLGLSVVDGIMKNHGGAITVYSQPGKGTALRLYFTATRDSVESLQPQPAPIAAGHGQRILYVDDDEALVFLATRTLTRLGYQVTGCTDPRQAVETFRAASNDYDAVVTDLSMPGMPGTELVREMRAIRPDVPVVITSGYIRPEDQDAARQLGATALILKPNTIEELGRVLDKVFRDRTS